jgi:hypothetical protein
MTTVKTLAIASLALAGLSLMAQQPQTTQAPSAQAPPEATQPMQQPAEPPAAASSAEMSPVNGELVDKLDSKTAKTGDSVVVKTKSDVRTAGGAEIPKGSKLVGKVVQAKASGQGNDNSQVALQFDHVELKGGQSMPIRAEIVGLSASDAEMNSGAPNAMASAPSAPSSGPATANGGMNGSPSTSSTAQAPTTGASPDANAGPAAGTVVARTGNIAIRTTAIPGVLLANNEPGQQDPRMAQSSGILLGPKRDIQLESGTRVVIGVASPGTAQGGGQ